METEVTDLDREEIARFIKEGYTSGRVDSEENGFPKCITWELKTNVWITD